MAARRGSGADGSATGTATGHRAGTSRTTGTSRTSGTSGPSALARHFPGLAARLPDRLKHRGSRGMIEVGVAAVVATLVAGTFLGSGIARTAVHVADGLTWLPDSPHGDVVQINPASGRAENRLGVGVPGADLTVTQSDGRLVVVNNSSGVATAYDLGTLLASGNRQAAKGGRTQVVMAGGNVFVVDKQASTIAAVDPTTLVTLGRIWQSPQPLSAATADGSGRVWALDRNGGLTSLGWDRGAKAFAQRSHTVIDHSGPNSVLVAHDKGVTVFGPDQGIVARVGTDNDVTAAAPKLEGQVLAAVNSPDDLVPASVPATGTEILVTADQVREIALGAYSCGKPDVPAVLDRTVYIPCDDTHKVIRIGADGNRVGDDIQTPTQGNPQLVSDDGRLLVNVPGSPNGISINADGTTNPFQRYDTHLPRRTGHSGDDSSGTAHPSHSATDQHVDDPTTQDLQQRADADRRDAQHQPSTQPRPSTPPNVGHPGVPDDPSAPPPAIVPTSLPTTLPPLPTISIPTGLPTSLPSWFPTFAPPSDDPTQPSADPRHRTPTPSPSPSPTVESPSPSPTATCHRRRCFAHPTDPPESPVPPPSGSPTPTSTSSPTTSPSSPSSPTSPTSSPAPEPRPTSLTASSAGTDVTVGWAEDSRAQVTGFDIERSDGQSQQSAIDKDQRSFVLHGQQPGSYSYTVVAHLASGKVARSDPSAQVTVQAAAPSGVTGTPNDATDSVDISWTPPSTGAPTSYTITDNQGSTPVSRAGDTVAYTWQPVKTDTPLTYTVTAVYGSVTAASTPSTAVTVSGGTPTAGTVTRAHYSFEDDTNMSFSVTWTAATAVAGHPITGYRVNATREDNNVIERTVAADTLTLNSSELCDLACSDSSITSVTVTAIAGDKEATSAAVTPTGTPATAEKPDANPDVVREPADSAQHSPAGATTATVLVPLTFPSSWQNWGGTCQLYVQSDSDSPAGSDQAVFKAMPVDCHATSAQITVIRPTNDDTGKVHVEATLSGDGQPNKWISTVQYFHQYWS